MAKTNASKNPNQGPGDGRQQKGSATDNQERTHLIWKRILAILFPILILALLVFGPKLKDMIGIDDTYPWAPFHPITILLVAISSFLVYGLLFRKKWTNILLILFLVFSFIGILISYSIGPDAVSKNFSESQLLTLVMVSGAFGGLMYGMRNGKWIWPKTEDGVTQVGFIRHLLIGIAGGIVIFIILPGDFEITKGSDDQIKFIQFIGLAFIGGFGGYALVEKVLEETLNKAYVDDQLKEQAKKEKADAETIELLVQYLDNEEEKPSFYTEKLATPIQGASLKTRLEILNKVKEFRTNKWIRLIGSPMDRLRKTGSIEAGDKESMIRKEKRYQGYVEKVFPILQTLSKAPDAEEYHRFFGQLGFALKDKSVVDYPGAAVALSKAIQIRDKAQQSAGEMYPFNRVICLLMQNDTSHADTINQDLLNFARNRAGMRIMKKLLTPIKTGDTDKPEKDFAEFFSGFEGVRTIEQNLKIFNWIHAPERAQLLADLKRILGEASDT